MRAPFCLLLFIFLQNYFSTNAGQPLALQIEFAKFEGNPEYNDDIVALKLALYPAKNPQNDVREGDIKLSRDPIVRDVWEIREYPEEWTNRVVATALELRQPEQLELELRIDVVRSGEVLFRRFTLSEANLKMTKTGNYYLQEVTILPIQLNIRLVWANAPRDEEELFAGRLKYVHNLKEFCIKSQQKMLTTIEDVPVKQPYRDLDWRKYYAQKFHGALLNKRLIDFKNVHALVERKEEIRKKFSLIWHALRDYKMYLLKVQEVYLNSRGQLELAKRVSEIADENAEKLKSIEAIFTNNFAEMENMLESALQQEKQAFANIPGLKHVVFGTVDGIKQKGKRPLQKPKDNEFNREPRKGVNYRIMLTPNVRQNSNMPKRGQNQNHADGGGTSANLHGQGRSNEFGTAEGINKGKKPLQDPNDDAYNREPQNVVIHNRIIIKPNARGHSNIQIRVQNHAGDGGVSVMTGGPNGLFDANKTAENQRKKQKRTTPNEQ